ncbi:MAG: hypothetical protein ACJAYU_001143 [Bradymonadia bacterium]|jgi:hypothetical protein
MTSTNQRTLRTCALLALSSTALLTSGCAGLVQLLQGGGGGGGAAAAEEAEEYSGPVTFINQSSHEICSLQWGYGERVIAEVQLSTGDQYEFNAEEDQGRLILTECGGARTVYGSQGSVGSPGQRITSLEPIVVLYDVGQAQEVSGQLAIEVNNVPIQNWLPTVYNRDLIDPGLASTMLDITTSHASRNGWSEEFVVGFPGIAEWEIYRNNLTSIITRRVMTGMLGATWNDGHCTLQQFGFQQVHDGSGFNGNITFAGVGPQWQVPCAYLDYMAGEPGVSGPGAGGTVTGVVSRSGQTSGAGSGSICTNTCGTPNDGECDDGGPGSLYSICSYGTDCNDCGTR